MTTEMMMATTGTTGAATVAGVPVPSRAETVERARTQGLRILAALPYHYPRGLLRAHGFHAMEVWAPRPETAAASGAAGQQAGAATPGGHFQAYACPIVTVGTAYLVGGGFDAVDAVLVPHGCDALQGMGSVLTDFVGRRPPVLTLYPPRGRRRVDRDYLAAELRVLAGRLRDVSGIDPDPAAWAAATEAEERADEAFAALYRRRGTLALTDREFYTAVRAREYLLPEDFVALVEALPAASEVDSATPEPNSDTDRAPARTAAGDGVPLVLSGIVADPLDLFDTLAEAGARVVADDLGSGSRRLLPASAIADPIERWADRFLRGPEDPTRADPIAGRVDRLLHLVESSRARGVLVVDPPFCEPEQFYLPHLRAALARHDVPLLAVEHETGAPIGGQLTSRIEAFVETLS